MSTFSDAQRDAQDLGKFVNAEPDVANPGHPDGTFTNRAGTTAAVLGKIIADIPPTGFIGRATYDLLDDEDGFRAETLAIVPLSDGGNHVDPVVGGNVPNSGVFRRSDDPIGWERIAAVDGLEAVAQFQDAVDDALTEIETARTSALAAVNEVAVMVTESDGDGYIYHPVRGTRYKLGVGEDGKPALVIYPHIFIDPENGNDAWDGTCGYRKGATTQGPIKTRTRMEALAAFAAVGGCTIAIRAKDDGTPWREGFDYYDPNLRNTGIGRKHRLSFVVYGGTIRRLSCLDIIAKNTMAAHPTIAGAYRITVNHDMHTGGVSSLRIFQDNEPLVRKSTDAAVAAEGTFYYAGVIAEGVPIVVDFHPWGGGNPITDGHIYEVTMRDYAIGAGDACYVEGIWGYANGSNNGSISLYNDARVQRSITEQGTKHNWVIGADCDLRDLVAINCVDANNYSTDAIGNLAVVFSDRGNGKAAHLTRCAFLCDGSMYAHSDGGATISQSIYEHMADGQLSLMRLDSCWIKNCGSNAAGEAFRVELIDHVDYGSNATPGAWVGAGDFELHVERGLFLNMGRFASAQKLYVHNAILVGANAVVNQYYGGSPVTMDIRENIIVGMNEIINNIPAAGAHLNFTGNLFTSMYTGYTIPGAPNGATSIVIENNRYEFGLEGVPPTANSSMGVINGTVIGTFAAWQALGYDTHGSVGPLSDKSAWLSGNRPTTNNVDIRLSPTGPARTLALTPIEQARVTEYLSRPTLYAAVVNYVKNVAPKTPVWDGMS